MLTVQAQCINVRGVVQGVGFRPFIYGLAVKYGLNGWVQNTSGDVTIVVEGDPGRIEKFVEEIRSAPPPQSRIETITTRKVEPTGFDGFTIMQSAVKENEYQLISPDIATCDACREEFFDINDRRSRYPFTNCTNCGPRFTIIRDIPYDRPRTTMSKFKMCPACQREYDNPLDRRFHAQPNACPVCGPELELTDSQGVRIETGDVIGSAAALIKQGKILALKGLGGYLLTCDAGNDETVSRLRDRKRRRAKPFAIMLRDLDEVERFCRVSEAESELLKSAASPIVLLKRTEIPGISALVAPGLNYLGVMLPYTPLHHLLMSDTARPLIMTSGNISEEPIIKDNDKALRILGRIADYFVNHNRDIYSSYDDSVVMVENRREIMLRRARGYAPYPVHLPFKSKSVLACGAEMKNTFCLTRENHAFVSQHIGDMENEETLDHFEETVELYEKMFRVTPEIMACDLHPEYLSTKWAEAEARKRGLPLIKVQHHHAHTAACMADNGITGKVIGAALDGTGYGTDGHIWGGEFMLAGYRDFERKAHFEYLPLPGGAAAIRKPCRAAAGYLYALMGEAALTPGLAPLRYLNEGELDIIRQQIDQKINTPLTSSAGRLFDVISSLLDIRHQVEYEGQAAIELEMVSSDDVFGFYPYQIENLDGMEIIRVRPLIEAILNDLKKKTAIPEIACKFHHTVADIIGEVCFRLSILSGTKKVALSGGVFQNRLLLGMTVDGLKAKGLVPLTHNRVPPNDGCMSLGQAVIANFINMEKT